MKIGILGPSQSVSEVMAVLRRNHPYVEGIPIIYENYIQSVDLLEKYQQEVDTILFTGTTAFQYASGHIHPQVIWEYLPRNQISLLCALLKAAFLNHWDISRVSVDSYPDKLLYSTYQEIGYGREDIAILRAPYTIQQPDYIRLLSSFHQEAYFSGKVSICITGIEAVDQYLRQLEVPCVKINPVTEVILQQINRLMLRYQLRLSDSNMTGVMAIRLDFMEEHSLTSKNQLEVFRSRGKIYETIYAFAQRLGAAVVEADGLFYLFTTKAVLENDTDHFTRFELLDTIGAKGPNYRMMVGIGLSPSAADAKYNAELACKKAMQQGQGGLYIAYADSQVIGPVTSKKSGGEGLVDQRLYQISQHTGIGIRTLYRLENVLAQYNISTITPAELALYLGITPRSTNRLLCKLEEAGYARVVGKTAPIQSGRPSRIVSISFEEPQG